METLMHGFEVEARSGDIPVDYNELRNPYIQVSLPFRVQKCQILPIFLGNIYLSISRAAPILLIFRSHSRMGNPQLLSREDIAMNTKTLNTVSTATINKFLNLGFTRHELHSPWPWQPIPR